MLERACVLFFFLAAEKERFKSYFPVYNLHQSAEDLPRLMESDPTAYQSNGRARCDWLISGICANPLNSGLFKSDDVSNGCQFLHR